MIHLVLALLFLIKLKLKRSANAFEYFYSIYGANGLDLYKKVHNVSMKNSKLKMDLDFLVKCKVYNMFPKFLRFKLYKKSLHSSKFYKSWQAKLLTQEISQKRKFIAENSTNLNIVLTGLQENISTLDFYVARYFLKKAISNYEQKTSKIHLKKLENLGILNNIEPCDPNNVIYNFSSVQLSHRIRTLLAFGLDFCLPVFNLNYYKFFVPIENFASSIEDKFRTSPNFNLCMKSLQSISNKYFYGFKSYKIFSSVFDKNDINKIRSLASNKNIIVSKPDKGKGVVIINKSDYMCSMDKIVSNDSKFLKVSENLSKFNLKIEDKINRFLLKLKNLNVLSTDLYNKLHVSGSHPGILYGLPKVHKKDFSDMFQFRPIFNAINTPSYNISKFLVPHLSHLTKNDYAVKDSFDFVSDICKIDNANDYYMASFDIENLFTNVPLGETISIILNLLFTENISHFLGMTKSLFQTFLELSVLNSSFIFNGSLYKQVDGLGMGLPLGPTFANIFMCFQEKLWLDACPVDYKPIFYRRYMDDSFLLFRDQTHSLLFLNFLNSKHPNIKFTSESEINNKLTFLDCLVTRRNNKFETSIYRKSTFSGLGLSFFSFTPFVYKINVLKTLISRGSKICSNFTNLNRELSFIVDFLFYNGYPKKLVYSTIRKFFENGINSQNSTNLEDIIYFKFPYFGHQSQKFKKEIHDILKKYVPEFNFRLVFVNKCTVGSFFRYKDTLPLDVRSSLVYQYSCPSCTYRYVGSTYRNFYMRVNEHSGKSFRTGQRVAKPVCSSILDHSFLCNGNVNFSNFKILGYENSKKLRILESLYIFKTKPELNDLRSAQPLLISH